MQTRSLRLALVAALALGVATAPAALASHMTAYTSTPEHDDIGRSNEPDNQATSVLGLSVTSCNVDDTLNGLCEGYDPAPANPVTGSRVVAPGCTGDAGRQASGTCYLTMQAGAPAGLSGNAAPGAFTVTKGDPVRFLDAQTFVQPVAAYAGELNHKLADSGLAGVLATAGFSGRVNVGMTGLHAWYGTFTDKNGNGVIDHSDDTFANEFVWRGNCLDAAGSLIDPALCQVESTNLLGWIYPGSHHAFVVPDAPGAQVLCFASIVAQAGATVCTASLEDIDSYDEDFQSDPLLGRQDSVAPDFAFDDRSGEVVNGRQYIGGNGFAFWHYDQSIIVREALVAAMDAPVDGSARGYNPAAARFRDVDVYPSWNPAVEAILQEQVKPTARSNWVTVLDSYTPVNKGLDGRLNSRATGANAPNDAAGPLDDQLANPGWSHEPNTAGDAYPGALRGACAGDAEATHKGFCNRYDGYANRHAFADNQAFRTINLLAPTVGGTPIPGLIYGPGVVDGSSVGVAQFPRAPGEHPRSLGPGSYDFLGSIGVWQDKSHRVHEAYVDLIAGSPTFGQTVDTEYNVARDGWVGNVVNTTGQYRYRDFAPQPCTVYGVTATFEYAVCHPYAHGALSDAQDYASSDGEFEGQCTSNAHTLTVTPDGGVWTAPTFVYRGLEKPELTTVNEDLEDWTGRGGSITLALECIQGTATTSGLFVGRDMLVLPSGNAGFGVTSTLTTAALSVGPGATERVVDVDYYVAFA